MKSRTTPWILASALGALGLMFAGCGDGETPTTSSEFRTVSAGATQQARDGTEVFGATVLREGTAVAVMRLQDGTLVAGGTPLTAAEATKIAFGPDGGGGGLTPTVSPSAQAATPTPVVPIQTPVTGGGRIAFESYGPISAASGAEFQLALVTDGIERPYQGYQWDVYANDTIVVLREEPVTAAGLETCSGLQEVAVNQHYGGCIHIGPKITSIYTGRLTVLTFSCASAGSGQIRLLNALEGAPFSTSYIMDTGAEFGTANTASIDVTCT